MDRGEESDAKDIIEGHAPYLKPVRHAEGDNFICCSEVPKVTKNFCAPPSRPVRAAIHCLSKTGWRRPAQTKSKTGLHERDILFRPMRWRCKKRSKMAEKILEPSLGAPIGLTTSSFNMSFLETRPIDIPLQGFSTLLMAFAEYFITPEIEWDEKVLNRILIEGQRLFNDSKAELKEKEMMSESAVKRTFLLCENAFDILVKEPFLIGNVVGEELPVPNLHWGLTKFFKKFQFCLVQIGNWFVLLWKNAEVYFVFDCFGRRTQDLRSDRKLGIAVLICLRNLDNVSHLILNLSGVRPDMLFTIRQLQLKSLIPCGGKPIPSIVDRSIQFEVISPDYAVLRGTIHLGSPCFVEMRYKHSLPVALAALLNAKIDATPTWDNAVVDKVLKLGAEFYKQWSQCDISLDMGIQDVPNRFTFGQFMVQIAVTGITECGMWKCTPNYRETEITQALQRAFEQGSNLIVQIQGRSYALWKKGTFYYVMDPYSHKCSLAKKKMATASVRMCGTLDRLSCVFTQALLELFEESKFLIRVVKILELEEIDKIDMRLRKAHTPCMCLATAQTDIAEEVMSINESVLGVDGYECGVENEAIEEDGDDLDSPGLSQTRMEDYTDMRKDFAESDSESEEVEDDVDLDQLSADMLPSDKDDDDDKH